MRKLISSFSLLLFLMSISSFSLAQDEMVQNEEMKIWMEYMTPGKMHNMLAKSVGEWKSISKFWMNPAGEPMVNEGLANAEMMLGGRYLKTVHTGMMMGMPFEGISILGYDNAIGEFTHIWIDNIGTGTSVSRGTYDANTASLNMTGTMVDPMSKKEMQIRTVMKITDENNQLFEMFLNYEGQEFKSMEIEFVRK